MPLSDPQIATLRSLLDRLIPQDEEPSACEAGVDTFVLGLLEGDGRAMADEVSAGLGKLEAAAQARSQRAFAQLPAPEQDALLDSFDPGFVWRMNELCAQGYYGKPAK